MGPPFSSVNCVCMYVKGINQRLKCVVTFEVMFTIQQQRSILLHCDQARYLQPTVLICIKKVICSKLRQIGSPDGPFCSWPQPLQAMTASFHSLPMLLCIKLLCCEATIVWETDSIVKWSTTTSSPWHGCEACRGPVLAPPPCPVSAGRLFFGGKVLGMWNLTAYLCLVLTLTF